MKIHIEIHTYSYAFNANIYELLHYYKIRAKLNNGDYMPLREHYGYKDLNLPNGSSDQILCQLINLNYTNSLLLNILKTTEYDDVEIDIMWGGKPKRAKEIVESRFMNYTSDEKKQAILQKVRNQINELKTFVPSQNIREKNARDLLGYRNVKRDGYKYNRAVGLTLNKMPNGAKFSKDIMSEFQLSELFEKDHIRNPDRTKLERARKRRERLKGKRKTTKVNLKAIPTYSSEQYDRKQRVIQFGKEVFKREAMQKNTYNYLNHCLEEEKVWIKNCYKHLLNALLELETDIKLVNTIGTDLSSPKAIRQEITRVATEERISIDLDNSFISFIDEFASFDEEDMISFKDYIDEYDGYDLYID